MMKALLAGLVGLASVLGGVAATTMLQPSGQDQDEAMAAEADTHGEGEASAGRVIGETRLFVLPVAGAKAPQEYRTFELAPIWNGTPSASSMERDWLAIGDVLQRLVREPSFREASFEQGVDPAFIESSILAAIADRSDLSGIVVARADRFKENEIRSRVANDLLRNVNAAKKAAPAGDGHGEESGGHDAPAEEEEAGGHH